MKKQWLPLLYFFSGVSGLIYEAVWMRMLIRVFGITIYATSTIISVFMGGLALGSWAMGRLAARQRISIRWYGAIEAGVALSAILSTHLMATMPTWSLAQSQSLPLRLALSFLVLFIPTFLMGSTLPLLSEWGVKSREETGSRLGLLYGINTMGAVIGVLLTGFFLIGTWGEKGSVNLGVAINLIIACMVYGFPSSLTPKRAVSHEAPNYKIGWYFFLAVAAASGFCALSYEVIWTRLLILLLGSSAYAFSIMLAIYLTGIALGSLWAGQWKRKYASPGTLIGGFEMLLGGLGIGSLWIFRALGIQASNPLYLYSPLTAASDFPRLFLMAILVILPLTIILGVIFPLLGRALSQEAPKAGVGRAVGALYGWNTVGGVVGSLLTGFYLIPWLGTQGACCLVSLLNLLIGVVTLAREGAFARRLVAIGVLASSFFVIEAIPSHHKIFLEILTQRLAPMGPAAFIFHREGAEATVSVYHRYSDDKRALLVNGIAVSARDGGGELMAHLPLLLHPHPASALVICFGAGNTFHAAVDHVGKVDAVELVPDVINSFQVMTPDSAHYLNHPGARIFNDDGRHYVLNSKDRYDAIIVDASPPIFSAGTVNLYSYEFLALCKARLNESGLMCLWVPLPCFESDFWMIARNFEELFPHVRVWTLPKLGGMFLMGSSNPLESSVGMLAERIQARHLNKIAPWLTPDYLQEGLVLSEDQLKEVALKYPPVTDDHPYTEFPLGRFLAKETFWWTPDFILKARNPA